MIPIPHIGMPLYICYAILKDALAKGLFYSFQCSFLLEAYTDLDWAACRDSKKFIIGYCIVLGTSLISWKIKKQNTVSRFSAKAEYQALGTTVCELQWIFYIARDLLLSIPTPVPFWCDN